MIKKGGYIIKNSCITPLSNYRNDCIKLKICNNKYDNKLYISYKKQLSIA